MKKRVSKSVKVWVARDDERGRETWVFRLKPRQVEQTMYSDHIFWTAQRPPDGSGGDCWRSPSHMGLKPGELKRATLTVDE